MSLPDFETIAVGCEIPALVIPPITRQTLALYAGGSGDHNPIHTDIDFARNEAGLDDVIVFGMLVKAYLGRLLTQWTPQTALKVFDTRFMAVIHIGDAVTCTGKVVKKYEGDNGRLLDLELFAVRQDGTVLAKSTATVQAS